MRFAFGDGGAELSGRSHGGEICNKGSGKRRMAMAVLPGTVDLICAQALLCVQGAVQAGQSKQGDVDIALLGEGYHRRPGGVLVFERETLYKRRHGNRVAGGSHPHAADMLATLAGLRDGIASHVFVLQVGVDGGGSGGSGGNVVDGLGVAAALEPVAPGSSALALLGEEETVRVVLLHDLSDKRLFGYHFLDSSLEGLKHRPQEGLGRRECTH